MRTPRPSQSATRARSQNTATHLGCIGNSACPPNFRSKSNGNKTFLCLICQPGNLSLPLSLLLAHCMRTLVLFHVNMRVFEHACVRSAINVSRFFAISPYISNSTRERSSLDNKKFSHSTLSHMACFSASIFFKNFRHPQVKQIAARILIMSCFSSEQGKRAIKFIYEQGSRLHRAIHATCLFNANQVVPPYIIHEQRNDAYTGDLSMYFLHAGMCTWLK